jgi:Predicted NAD/FAD-binding protein
MKKKIAVIGSGISGLSASYYLRQKFHIQLFEQNDYLGGHTHTHTLTLDSKNVNVDSGFIVFNNFNYHNFIKFIKELKIKYQISDMSFSVTSLKKNTNGLEKI